jgi:hypothetical protein
MYATTVASSLEGNVMAATTSYWNVSDKGYASFLTNLANDPWAEIPPPDPATPLSEVPTIVVLKHRLDRGVRGVLTAMGVSNKVMVADQEWDRCQARLGARVSFDENDADPERRAAARRVRAALLSGGGTGQNALAPDLEVDFGGAQVNQCKDGTPLFADIQALGYQPLIHDIRVATDALAVAVGREIPGPRPLSRSIQIREAVRAAARAFNAVDDSMDDLLAETAEGTPAHAQLTKLRLSLQTLLARYATHTPPAGADDPVPENPAAPSTPATPTNPGGSPFVE